MKENAYFDNAATTWPKPEPVYRFMDSFFRSHGVNPGRSGSLLAVEAEQMIMTTRRMLAGFFGFSGDANRVIFTLNGTDSLNMAIAGLTGPGDHVVTTRLEHNAVLRTTRHLERDQGLLVSRIAPGADGFIDPSSIKAAIRPDTRAIVLNHASNVIGTVQPLAEVADIAHRAGIPLIVDAAQTAGVIPIDMDALGIAVLAFPGHKGLFGPMGIGGMIVAESVDLAPCRYGGTGVDSLSEFQPAAYPYHLEAGTVSIPGIAGLHAAQRWFRDLGYRLQQGACVTAQDESAGTLESLQGSLREHATLCQLALRHVHAVEMGHLARIIDTLSQYRKARVLPDGVADRIDAATGHDRQVATLSFTVAGLPTEQIADRLDADHQICARAGLQCAPLVHVDANTAESGGTIRLSPGYFTDEQDMQQLLAALHEILG